MKPEPSLSDMLREEFAGGAWAQPMDTDHVLYGFAVQVSACWGLARLVDHYLSFVVLVA